MREGPTFVRVLLVAVCVLCTTLTTRAQQRWVQSFSGSQRAADLSVAADGGVFLVGSSLTNDPGVFDAWIARLDADGVSLWERNLEAPGWDEAFSVLSTPDGGCIVAGFTASSGAGGRDGWLVKLDAVGSVQWQRTYGDADDNEFVAVANSPDGYYVGGITGDSSTEDYDAWVLEVDLAGDVLWQQNFGGDFEDRLMALSATPGGVVLTVDARSAIDGEEGKAVAFYRPWMVQLDGDGNTVWQKTYNYSGGDGWNAIAPVSDGYLVVGEIIAKGFHRGDVWVVKLDVDGDVVWDRRYGDNFGTWFYDAAVDVVPTADGGAAVLATTATAGVNQAWWLLKLDALGVLQWDRVYDAPSFDTAIALEQTPGGDLYAGGSFGTTAMILRLGPNGTTSCDLSSPTAPQSWTDSLMIEATAGSAVSTRVAPSASSATADARTSDAFLCLPTPLAFCDASDGALASCPCANPGNADTGCDLAQATGGVGLDVLGQETSPQNRVTLSGSGYPAGSTPAAVVIRSADLDPAAPIVFGDGLRCVGLPVVRLGAALASGGTSLHVFGHGTMAGGGTFSYQLWLRNTPIMYCDPAAAFNLSNGRVLTW
jgi:hypothetical protein